MRCTVYAAVIVVVVVPFGYWATHYSAGAIQRQRMVLAADHIKLLQPLLDRDERFRDVDLYPYTARHGTLGVGGEIEGAEALADLREIVLSSEPPVEVVWHVEDVVELNRQFKAALQSISNERETD